MIDKSETKHFLISKNARDKYDFEEELFTKRGEVVFTNYHSVRKFAERINKKRNVVEFPENAVSAAEINGIGLIHEISHFIIEKYVDEKDKNVFKELYQELTDKYTKDKLNKLLEIFLEEFPPLEIYKNNKSAREYIEEQSSEQLTSLSVEELILVWLSNKNPAFSDYLELFNDEQLERVTPYNTVLEDIQKFFNKKPRFGPQNQSLVEMLMAPFKSVPHSIEGQLDWIRRNWGDLLGDYFYKILRGVDFIKEETKLRGLGPGPNLIQKFDKLSEEYERFSQDLDWMPNVVIIAKNTYVWLHQLSKKYDRTITNLDEIPDEELDLLAQRGFKSLWLIGLWERSKASQKIKQIMGKEDAVASAYSLYDYVIAEDLGGEKAFQNLRNRARSRGIRLCGDMVPNHVGIDGKWVIEHPDWFIYEDHPPFPGYSFEGADLCEDDRVSIYIEDHYYEESDAAVVFKRVDNSTGDVRYIYHGNDGTSMPWNDTAQLNYLKEEVREAVIQTILHVAQKFDVIRFDAAMTLAKKHYHRLWFPQPGAGGDIPSRTEHSMTKEEFNEWFPEEFWREVVDRVKEEEPDTLLLAEAFWMMEGYFVRTLGMHRVYNSAFMDMLKNEDNQKYRDSIKNVLEFDPQILKRYVNFMNNPDEETAHAQFGADDKYFGVCTMMVTLPGLPMFGHGQVEGFKEKYGMEFKKPMWDEDPNQELVERHEEEIFPLLHKRYLFSEVDNFYFYDFKTDKGNVNENVFAYSNVSGNQKVIVLYNNKYQKTAGRIKMSVPYNRKESENDKLHRKNLAEALELKNDSDHYCIFRDHKTGREYIRNNKKLFEEGLFVSLEAFKYHVFLDFREVKDEQNIYSELSAFLNGRGVPDINRALQLTLLQPVHNISKKVFDKEKFNLIYHNIFEEKEVSVEKVINSSIQGYNDFLEAIIDFMDLKDETEIIIKQVKQDIYTHCKYSELFQEINQNKKSQKLLQDKLDTKKGKIVDFFGLFINPLGKLIEVDNYPEQSRSLIEELHLSKIIEEFGRNLDCEEDETNYAVALIKILGAFHNWPIDLIQNKGRINKFTERLLKDSVVRDFVGINRYKEVLWFDQESFEDLLEWLHLIGNLRVISHWKGNETKIKPILEKVKTIVNAIEEGLAKSDYKVNKLLEILAESRKGS